MKEKLYPALQLTDACNKRCTACLRVPGKQSHTLAYSDFEKYLEDVRTLNEPYDIGFQFVTGGEPTIWKDRTKDVGDIIMALSNHGNIRNITMPTNGKRFENKAYVTDLLKRISGNVDHTVIIGLSIAAYQENFVNNRCVPLENLLEASAQPGNKILPIALVTLFRDDNMDQRLKQSYPGVIQRITPLAPLGGGQDMIRDCPSISLSGSKKDTLGTFMAQFRQDVAGRLNITMDQFESTSNHHIMNRLSLFAHCGQSPFIDDRWHYCLPFREDPDFDIAPIGGMTKTSITDFITAHPFLHSIRTRGLLDTLDHYKDLLSRDTREKLDIMFSPDHLVSVAYRGCMICKELAEIGVWKEIQQGVCQ
ncbi:MAG: hypothetical protein KKD44_15770 [Proteobacteria bacterium]|nr:hypothetical protein [Pseudomonadota bacterium]